MKVDISAWVAQHHVEQNTSYWHYSRGRVRLRLWKDGEVDPFFDTGATGLYFKEVRLDSEEHDVKEDIAEADWQGYWPTSDFKLEYSAMGSVWMLTGRADGNILNVKAATDHGAPGSQIGKVRRKADGAFLPGDTPLQ